ncbi:DUF4040 family protein [Staphylococcus condimenti]|uniref:DUF4040 family protein n=1 Tax=Staphylococcus condimenti TaxID=70255 RepID=A0A4Q7CN68_9STAP|nr:DUF4040 family protein [Staphylococcus condimenti]RZI01304.1 DUF4040 family protein [Staphylococcus condimenti]RZI04889.1 DUF4040 family protein [Staphylococcus condimenti]
MSLIWLLIFVVAIMSVILATNIKTKKFSTLQTDVQSENTVETSTQKSIKPFARFSGWIALIAPVVSAIYFVFKINQTAESKITSISLPWMPVIDLDFAFRLDGLSMIFALLITLIGTGVVLYANAYLSKEHDDLPRFYFYLILFMFAMLGVVLADNTILLYVFWELTSIASFLLISYWYNRKASQNGALKSFLITVFGGMFMLIGFIIIYSIAKTNTISELVTQTDTLSASPWFPFAVVCILIGAFTKSAQFPFHIWLPDAMEAPTPVSAYLHSATMVKAGLYLLFRFTTILSYAPWVGYIVITIGIITLAVGSFVAVGQRDLKALLAYSTISQLGMIMSMVGFGMLTYSLHHSFVEFFVISLFAGLFHLINHALFKSVLFMGVGIIDHETGTRNLAKLGGLRKLLPVTATIMTISAMAMAGLPFFNGFLSKEMFFTTLVNGRKLPIDDQIFMSIMLVVAIGASVLTFVYSLRMIKDTFFGPLNKEKLPHIPGHEPISMYIAPVIIVCGLPLFFIIPNVLGKYLITPALRDINHTAVVEKYVPHIAAWHGFTAELGITLIIYAVGILLLWRSRWMKVYNRIPSILSINSLYNAMLKWSEGFSRHNMQTMMNNKLNQYLHVIYLMFFGMLAYGFIKVGWIPIKGFEITPFTWFEILVLVNIIILSAALLYIRERMAMVILNGVIGYSIAIVFILMKAPDLAMTQLVIETITTILFLLVFHHLPNVQRDKVLWGREAVKLIIAFLMALFVMTFVVIALQDPPFQKISRFYEDSYDLAGSKNIVNAILGDFRALDTMLEGIVIMIVGLGIFALVKFKIRKDESNERK